MPKRKTNRALRPSSMPSGSCPTCHPIAGSHIVSMLLVIVFALAAVLMTSVVSSGEQRQVIEAQAALLDQLDDVVGGEAAP